MLVWILPNFTPSNRRLTQDDIITWNRGTAIVVDDETVVKSQKTRQFHIRVWVFIPDADSWHEDIVPFSDLKWNVSTQQIWYEFSQRELLKKILLKHATNSELNAEDALCKWQEIIDMTNAIDINLNAQYGMTSRLKDLLRSIESAERCRPFGWNYPKLISICHLLSGKDKIVLKIFMEVSRVTGALNIIMRQDRTKKWQEKSAEIQTNWNTLPATKLTNEERKLCAYIYPKFESIITGEER